MDYKAQVEKILSHRKVFLEDVKKDESNVNELSSEFKKLKMIY